MIFGFAQPAGFACWPFARRFRACFRLNEGQVLRAGPAAFTKPPPLNLSTYLLFFVETRAAKPESGQPAALTQGTPNHSFFPQKKPNHA
ncbi:MAG: hypothetical protein D6714_13860 [Bacteroidetes bacterium]|nr:MAG: hypothetical protein D6714_13860 [Bacteroidota bacterium]